MTVFDPSALRELVDGDDGLAIARQTARIYRRMLPRRVARVQDAVVAVDLEAAFDAVLSLKVSSTMVGAVALSHLAAELEEFLRCGNLSAARSHAAALVSAAAELDAALGSFLGEDERVSLDRAQASSDSIR